MLFGRMDNQANDLSRQRSGKSSINNNILNTSQHILHSNGNANMLDRRYPEPKSGHKLLAIGKEYLMLVGGGSSEQFYLSNVWMYSIKSKMWKKIELDISIPKQLGIDCCVVEPEDKEEDKEKEEE